MQLERCQSELASVRAKLKEVGSASSTSEQKPPQAVNASTEQLQSELDAARAQVTVLQSEVAQQKELVKSADAATVAATALSAQLQQELDASRNEVQKLQNAFLCSVCMEAPANCG